MDLLSISVIAILVFAVVYVVASAVVIRLLNYGLRKLDEMDTSTDEVHS